MQRKRHGNLPSAQIGANIRRVREAQELGQADLAASLGRTQAAISQWEKGLRSPSVEDLVEIARVLDQDVRVFLPPGREPTPVAGLLRAEVAQLDFGSLATMVESFLSNAERLEPIEPEFRIVDTNAIRAAQQLLAKASVASVPIPVEELAHRLGVRVSRWRFDDSLSGLVIDLDEGPVIGVNETHVQVRQRFTLAHELGHLLLGHGESFYVDLQARPEDGDPPGYHGAFEREANDFAANLLMPAADVRTAYHSDRSPEALARTFEVSDLAMRYRLANLGLR